MDKSTIYKEVNCEIAGSKFQYMAVTEHFQEAHQNPNPLEIAQYVCETLDNHGVFSLSERVPLVSCTAGFPKSLKGWPQDYRKTVIEPDEACSTLIFVTQYPLTKTEYKSEKRKIGTFY